MKCSRIKALLIAAIGCALGACALTTQAALSVTNGDFEAGTGNNIDDVTSWFDNSNGTFWQGSWSTNAGFITPNTTGVVVLGSYEGSGIQSTPSANPLSGNYVYQSIGTADGATSATIKFDWGAPNDDGGGRQLGTGRGCL
jgi:hypothetical protein